MKEPINWTELEARAAEMTLTALHNNVQGLRYALPEADARDRSLETDDGGRYRDEISVLRREILKRQHTRDAERPEYLAQIHNAAELSTIEVALAGLRDRMSGADGRAWVAKLCKRYAAASDLIAQNEGTR